MCKPPTIKPLWTILVICHLVHIATPSLLSMAPRLTLGRLTLLGITLLVFILYRYGPFPVRVENDDHGHKIRTENDRPWKPTYEQRPKPIQHVDYENERPREEDNSVYGAEANKEDDLVNILPVGDINKDVNLDGYGDDDEFIPSKFRPKPTASTQKFFGMWFSQSKELPDKMRLSLGSFFFHHPNATFTMYSNDLVPATFKYFTLRGYKVVVKKFHLVETFSKCAPNKNFVSWAMKGGYLRPGALNRNVHITDALRLCFSYLHGGVYMDMDIFILRPIDYTDALAYLNGEGGNCPVPPYELECSPPQQSEITFGGQLIWLPSEIYLSTGYYALSPRSKFAQMGLEHMMIYEDPNCWNCIGPRTFAHVYKHMKPSNEKPPLIPSCDDVRVPFYENNLESKLVDRWKEVRHCPYAHLFASAEKLEVKKGSLFYELVRDMCIGCDVFL